MAGSNTFAVPASAFRVNFTINLLVFLAGPLERTGQLDLVDFVVMVNEFACLRCHPREVSRRRQLVRVLL